MCISVYIFPRSNSVWIMVLRNISPLIDNLRCIFLASLSGYSFLLYLKSVLLEILVCYSKPRLSSLSCCFVTGRFSPDPLSFGQSHLILLMDKLMKCGCSQNLHNGFKAIRRDSRREFCWLSSDWEIYSSFEQGSDI